MVMEVFFKYISNQSLGHEVADFVKEHLITELIKLKSWQEKDYEKALVDIYLKMDEMI